jgi:hypothetical protein
MLKNTTAVSRKDFGVAWMFCCVAFALHVWDEAAHDFLGYYNATVLTLYGHFSWFPRVDMTFRQWLTGLLVALVFCGALTPLAFKNVRWLRRLAYLLALIQFLDGLGHISAQILGGTVPSVRFDGACPGIYTAPLLLAASAYLFVCLRKTRPRK